jgi:prepilin peptidase CpaA
MSLIPLLMLGAWAAAVAVFDVRFRRVPNWLVAIGLVCAIAQYLDGLRVLPLTIEQSLMGGLIAFVVFLPLYVFRAMGAADVKVFTVLGLWLGVSTLLPVWMIASAAAGVHAIYAIARPRLPPVVAFGRVLGRTTVYGGTGFQPLRGAPYAAFLVIAACCVALHRLYPADFFGIGG